MIIATLPVGLIETNCYLVGCEQTKRGAVVDPGGHPQRILAEAKRLGLSLEYVLNTHAHFDHTDANGALIEATGARLALHSDDLALLQASGGAAWFGMRAVASPAPDVALNDGDELEIGRIRFRVLHTPGHSPGHVCFYAPEEGVLFDGDVLFRLGVGRSDLPGGNWEVLADSIQRVLFSLPDDTVVYPGHGPATTIGEERRHNPWL